ncbi:MAG: four helix bundle protein [Bacteroidetes bacterium]|nr:four helix bundle protein [Bacteroidota bacterium]
MKPHQNLHAWKKSFDLVKELYLLTRTFPGDEKFGLTSQIRRAAVSIPVNIAEGAARKSKAEFIQFLHIALGSISELDTLILLSFELEYTSKTDCESIIEKLDIIGKLIFGLIKKLSSDK